MVYPSFRAIVPPSEFLFSIARVSECNAERRYVRDISAFLGVMSAHVRSQLISNYDRLSLSSSITLEFRFGRMQSDDAYSCNLRILAAYLQGDAGVACHSIYHHDRSSGVCEAGQSTPVAERKHSASSTSCSLTTHTVKRSSISRRTCNPFLPIILSRLAPKSGLLVRLSISKCTHNARRCRVRLRSYRFHAAINDTSGEVSRTSMR